jgi:hypothetical protein
LTPSAGHSDTSNAAVHECVPVDPGAMYNFGGRAATQLPGPDWNGECSVTFFNVYEDCKTDVYTARLGRKAKRFDDLLASRPPYEWVSFDDWVVAPAQSAYARFECDTVDDTGGEVPVYLDTLYLSPGLVAY